MMKDMNQPVSMTDLLLYQNYTPPQTALRTSPLRSSVSQEAVPSFMNYIPHKIVMFQPFNSMI
jgi:hypothetical protein